MRRVVGLLLLVLVSIALRIILERWTESLGWPTWPTVLRNTFTAATTTTIAIAAALMPRRCIIGLLLIVAFNVASFLAESVVGTKHSFSQWNSVQIVSLETAFALAIFIVFQGLRLFFGWCIIADGHSAMSKRGQFQLSELIEWTVSWAILFGLHKVSGCWATSSLSVAAQFSVSLLQQFLFSLPVIYFILRRKFNATYLILSIVAAACATLIWFFAQTSYVKLAVILPGWAQAAWAGFTLWLSLTAQFLVIRWLGYRFHR